MRLSDLQSKNIVSVVDGKIESLVIDGNKGFFSLNRESDTKIYWKDITKIGEDVILVNTRI